jgi:hypothetical protein
MKVKVTEQGVVIPKHLLPGIDEVDIRTEDGVVLVVPASAEDPILGLGRAPVACDLPDASQRHDHHLYGEPNG